jgi:uncharacterized protein YceK
MELTVWSLLLIPGVLALIGFLALLVFCAFVIMRTGSTDGLSDVATVLHALRQDRQTWCARAR